MRISVCITVKDEAEENIRDFLSALINQTFAADEIIIVDASSISNLKFLISNEFSNYKFKIIHKQNLSRSQGRNLAVKLAKNKIIAMTDAGCIPHKDWLENLTLRLRSGQASGLIHGIVVAGFYRMTFKNNLQKAMRVYLGILPNKFDKNFLPSTRSIAFTKTIWKRVNGFSEKFDKAGEDTDFNIKIVKEKIKIVRVKNAIVDWQMPNSLTEFFNKIYEYAKGDTVDNLASSHNIHSLIVLTRSLLAVLLLFVLIENWKFDYLYLFVFIGIYFSFAYRKCGFWGIVLQPISDIGVIMGFTHGIIKKVF